jgi:hypothetical protein
LDATSQWRRKEATGDVIIVRYADDAVLGFQHRYEAERFLEQKGFADSGRGYRNVMAVGEAGPLQPSRLAG